MLNNEPAVSSNLRTMAEFRHHTKGILYSQGNASYLGFA